MKRVIMVYNPRSSRYADVKREVLGRTRELGGYMIGKYEVAPTDIDDNIRKLGTIIRDDDIVLSVGGDATGVIAANAIMSSGKKACLAVLPYGNFNDLSRTLGTRSFDDIFMGETAKREFYPLEIWVDGKFFRYATCYVTMGMTAEAVQIYDSPKMRAKLKKKFGRKVGSYTELAGWYFKNRKHHIFISEFCLNGVLMDKRISDYAAVNGRSMARVMRGGEDYRDPLAFRHEVDRLTNFYRLVKLMSRSILSRIPGTVTNGDVIEFVRPGRVTLQAEGESKAFEGITRIEIRKSKKSLMVLEK